MAPHLALRLAALVIGLVSGVAAAGCSATAERRASVFARLSSGPARSAPAPSAPLPPACRDSADASQEVARVSVAKRLAVLRADQASNVARSRLSTQSSGGATLVTLAPSSERNLSNRAWVIAEEGVVELDRNEVANRTFLHRGLASPTDELDSRPRRLRLVGDAHSGLARVDDLERKETVAVVHAARDGVRALTTAAGCLITTSWSPCGEVARCDNGTVVATLKRDGRLIASADQESDCCSAWVGRVMAEADAAFLRTRTLLLAALPVVPQVGPGSDGPILVSEMTGLTDLAVLRPAGCRVPDKEAMARARAAVVRFLRQRFLAAFLRAAGETSRNEEERRAQLARFDRALRGDGDESILTIDAGCLDTRGNFLFAAQLATPYGLEDKGTVWRGGRGHAELASFGPLNAAQGASFADLTRDGAPDVVMYLGAWESFADERAAMFSSELARSVPLPRGCERASVLAGEPARLLCDQDSRPRLFEWSPRQRAFIESSGAPPVLREILDALAVADVFRRRLRAAVAGLEGPLPTASNPCDSEPHLAWATRVGQELVALGVDANAAIALAAAAVKLDTCGADTLWGRPRG